ncbi:MAG: RNA polymerase subunit sigma-70 [Planctomycetes bacterium]|nr:RNA polymerase subunit sigma-70 [Planctomycetota bacterium]
MSSSESVTEWLHNLKQGDSLAAQRLWQRYVARLIRLASRKLGNAPRRVADEEDVVIAAFASFCRGVEAGRFSRLDDRDDLWQVLIVLTERRAIDQMRREQAAKRGAGDVRGESALAAANPSGSSVPGVGRVVDTEPTPEFAALVAEECEQRLGALGDSELERIAVDKMAGYSNREISQRLGTSLRGVERRLQLIRRIWSQES